MNGFAMRLHSCLRLTGLLPRRYPKDPVVPSCPRVVGGIYQPSYTRGNHAKTHQNRDAVLPMAAGGGPFQNAAVYAPKQWKTSLAGPGL